MNVGVKRVNNSKQEQQQQYHFFVTATVLGV